MKKSLRRQAFTLIEIMIVLAIIGIIIAIAVPALEANRNSAVERTKQANITVVEAAIANYIADNVKRSEKDVNDIATIADYLGERYDTVEELEIAGQQINITEGKVYYDDGGVTASQ